MTRGWDWLPISIDFWDQSGGCSGSYCHFCLSRKEIPIAGPDTQIEDPMHAKFIRCSRKENTKHLVGGKAVEAVSMTKQLITSGESGLGGTSRQAHVYTNKTGLEQISGCTLVSNLAESLIHEVRQVKPPEAFPMAWATGELANPSPDLLLHASPPIKLDPKIKSFRSGPPTCSKDPKEDGKSSRAPLQSIDNLIGAIDQPACRIKREHTGSGHTANTNFLSNEDLVTQLFDALGAGIVMQNQVLKEGHQGATATDIHCTEQTLHETEGGNPNFSGLSAPCTFATGTQFVSFHDNPGYALSALGANTSGTQSEKSWENPTVGDASEKIFGGLPNGNDLIVQAALETFLNQQQIVQTTLQALGNLAVQQAFSSTNSPQQNKASHKEPAIEKKSTDIPICYDYVQGKCSRRNCKYSHDTQRIILHNSSEKGICFDHLRGECKRGALCRFSHDLINVMHQPVNDKNTRQHLVPQPPPGKSVPKNWLKGICYDFIRGACTRGSQCPWSHDLHEIATATKRETAKLQSQGNPFHQAPSHRGKLGKSHPGVQRAFRAPSRRYGGLHSTINGTNANTKRANNTHGP